MGEAAPRRATYDDLRAVPRHLVAEIVRGELRTHPRPAPPHARASTRLGSLLDRAFDEGSEGPGGWWILDEPELHLLDAPEVLVPDIAGWRVARLSELPEEAFFTVAPDWVCEVLSPSTEAEDRADKMPIYAEAGVGHTWLVDPVVRTLEVYRLDDGRWTLVETLRADDRVCAEPFGALTFPLSTLWARPRRS